MLYMERSPPADKTEAACRSQEVKGSFICIMFGSALSRLVSKMYRCS